MQTSTLIKKPISWIKLIAYALDDCRQRAFYERPSRSYREELARRFARPDFRTRAERLCRDGVLLLPGHFTGKRLEAMRADFGRWVEEGIPSDEPGGLEMNECSGAILRDSLAFSEAALDPWIIALARYYWGKPIFLAHSSGTRLDPDSAGNGLGPFRWHHDAHRKQLKAMIYLDDVPRDGQRMDYLAGTHRIWHRFKRGEAGYEETRWPDEAVTRYGEPLRCAGPAGTVVLFDTNGLHRGNRNLKAKRDVWVFQYTAGRHLEPFSGLHPEVAQSFGPEQKRIARL